MKFSNNGLEPVYLIDGICPFSKQEASFGVTKTHVNKLIERGNTVRLSHLLRIVDPGLIIAKHVFRGVKRPLCYGDDLDGDGDKLIYSWKPVHDYDWKGPRRFSPSDVIERPAPAGKVFVVITTPNTMRKEFPDVNYWIEGNWTWVEESRDAAPINHEERYLERLGF